MRLLAIGLVCWSCRSPCDGAFERGDDGVCRATSACSAGTQRMPDLSCAPVADAGGDGPVTDTATPAADTADVETIDDTGIAASRGRVRVVNAGLTGVPAHGFVVLATTEGSPQPSGAFCQIILQETIDIDGFVVPYENGTDPCPTSGDAMLFEPGPVELELKVVAGVSAEAVLCDVRVVDVVGETVVDFSDVEGCEP